MGPLNRRAMLAALPSRMAHMIRRWHTEMLTGAVFFFLWLMNCRTEIEQVAGILRDKWRPVWDAFLLAVRSLKPTT